MDIEWEDSDVICRCSGTTAGQIKSYFAKGLDDMDSLSRASGACSGCGGCESDVAALLNGLAAGRANSP